MARTRLCPRQQSQRDQQQLRQIMNKPLPPSPTIVGRRPMHRGGIGIKSMQVRNRNKKWKIKRQLTPAKNIHVKHRSNTVRKMTVQRRVIFPSFRGGIYQLML